MTKSGKSKKGLFRPIFYVLITLVVSLGLMPTLFKNLKFGLDLQGGFEVLYKVSAIDGDKVTSDMVTSTYKTMLKRIDTLGVSEPVITVEGSDRIRVQLAGVTNPDDARKLLSSAASLTFRDSSDNLLMNSDVIGKAQVGEDSSGKPAVSLTVKDKDKFYKVTKRISETEDKMIVIWLDFDEGVDSYATTSCGADSISGCLSAATVSEGFASDVIIQGNFELKEVEDLVDLINSGSLPTKLTEISSKTVGASFGEDALEKTFVAGLVGISIIIVFMTLAYRFAGFVASIGLILYTFLTFATFWVVGGVLTLPGIAAAIIGIGMAVDANVINFSRIKDELRQGKSFKNACLLGNKESLASIVDSNITTFIVAIILFIFGESSIKGFATMLMISIAITMFVMVFLVRFLLNKFVQTGKFDNKQNFFIGFKKDKEIRKEKRFASIDYVGKSKIFVAVSVMVLLLGIGSVVTRGMNLGIDFKGGSSITLQLNKSVKESTLKKDIKELGFELESISYVDDTNVDIIVKDSMSEEEVTKTNKYFVEKYEAKTDIGVVSNVVRKELIKNAVYSLLIACIGIIAYISLRFTLSYAISGLVALFHDVGIIIAMFSLLNFEVSTIFIAAILSIIGYSINDTIVTFDRIRENMNNKRVKNEEDLKEVVNLSLRQTIGRSLFTTLTTLFPVLALIFLGSYEIFYFNMALLFGLIAGAYSSIFIASQIWIVIEKRNIGKPKKKKWYDEKEPEELKVKGVNS